MAGEIPTCVTESEEVKPAREKLEFDFVENELIYNYEEPTYYFRWGLIPQSDFAFGFGLEDEKYRQKNKELNERIVAGGIDGFPESIIVAETGVTADLNIRNVEFDSVIGLEDGATKGNATIIKLEIFEPFGLSLPDNLSLAAKILGVTNWITSPMHVLELKFKGKKIKNPGNSNRNDDTEAFGDCVWRNKDQKTNRYIWRLQLMKMTAKADSGGTVYHIEAALNENFAKDVQHNTLATMITKGESNAGTPEEITTFIAEKMSQHITDQRSNGVSTPNHSFEILWRSSEELEKDLKNVYSVVNNPPWAGKITPSQDDTARSEGTGIDKDGHFSWNDGTSIQQIITDIQGATEDLRILMHGKRMMASGKQKKVNIESEETENKRVFKYEFRVETESILKGLDPRTNDYAYHFVFYIVPFAVSLGIPDEKKPKTRNKKNSDINKKIQKNRVTRFRQSGVVRKRYDYIYTGLNQDVLNFDIDMNLFFFAQVPKATSSYTETDPGVLNSRLRQQARNDIATNVQTSPGAQEALIDLAGGIGDDLRKSLAKKLGINPLTTDSAELLRIGLAAQGRGFTNNKLTKLIDDTAEAAAQQLIDKANNAVSTNLSIAKGQEVLRAINSAGSRGISLEKFRIFEADVIQNAEIGLVFIQDIEQSDLSELEKLKAIAKTLQSVQGELDSNEFPELSRELNESLNGLDSLIRNETQKGQKRGEAFIRQTKLRSRRKQSRFLLDLKSQFASREEQAQFENIIDETNPALFPIAVKADISDISAEGDQAVPQTDPASISQSLTMAMLNQIYGSNPYFQKIQLTIRGDPFWIGPGAERQIGFDVITKQLDPDYNKKQNMLFFQFRLPENYNPETGSMSFSTENMFKGLYIVIKVKHEFKDGKFIQHLDAVRELLTNMLKEGEETQPEVAAGPFVSRTVDPLPTSFINVDESTLNVVSDDDTFSVLGS